jgi:uncharacterized protein (TIGR03067 family)
MNGLPVLALAIFVGAPQPKDAPKSPDPPTLVGDWVCTGITDGGRVNTTDVEAPIEIEFTADGKIRFTKKGKAEPDGTYTADPKTDPPAMDLTLEPGGGLLRGIYKVEGGTLTVCCEDVDRGTRPERFAAPAGTKLMLLAFTRIVPKKE